MWIVRLALRTPSTFVVVAALIALVGLFSIVRMPTDLSDDRHPRRQSDLELRDAVRDRRSGPHHDSRRTRDDDDR
jgi:hypothetical protein